MLKPFNPSHPSAIHFSCKPNCGACCTSKDGNRHVQLAPHEIIDYAFQYPLLASLQHCAAMEEDADIAGTRQVFNCSTHVARQIIQRQKEQYAESCHFVPVQGWNNHTGVYLRADAILLPKPDGDCPALDPTSKICGIYNSRPLTCRIFPLHDSFPFGNVERSARSAISDAMADNGLCDASSTAPVLVRPTKQDPGWVVVNPDYRTQAAALGAARASRKRAAIAIHDELGLASSDLRRHAAGNKAAYSSVGLFFAYLQSTGVQNQTLFDILNRQYILLQERQTATSRKDFWSPLIDKAVLEIKIRLQRLGAAPPAKRGDSFKQLANRLLGR